MKRFCALALGILLLLPSHVEGKILLSQLYVDPAGVDSGQEWISLINTGTGSVALDGWLLDINNLPDLNIPNGITVQPQQELFFHFRSPETSSGNHLHFSDSFTTQNISNSAGFIALYSGNNKNTAPMEDYMLYGAPHGSYSSKALSSELWQPEWFITIPEGFVATRSNTNTPHHRDSWSLLPFTTPSPTPETSSGSTIDTGTGSTVEPPMTNHNPLPVISIQGSGARSGPAPFSLNLTGESSTDPDGDILSYWWDFGNGSTTDRSNPLAVSYTIPGTYTVHLTVTDTKGLSTTTTLQVEVSNPPTTTSSQSTSATPSSSTNNTSCTPSTSGMLLLSELLPNPEGTDTNHEWIELYNPGAQPIELCNWSVDDKEGESSPYHLPAFTLAANAFYIIESSISKLSLSNTLETVRLFSPLQQLVDSVSYTDAPSGKSYARHLP